MVVDREIIISLWILLLQENNSDEVRFMPVGSC